MLEKISTRLEDFNKTTAQQRNKEKAIHRLKILQRNESLSYDTCGRAEPTSCMLTKIKRGNQQNREKTSTCSLLAGINHEFNITVVRILTAIHVYFFRLETCFLLPIHFYNLGREPKISYLNQEKNTNKRYLCKHTGVFNYGIKTV